MAEREGSAEREKSTLSLFMMGEGKELCNCRTSHPPQGWRHKLTFTAEEEEEEEEAAAVWSLFFSLSSSNQGTVATAAAREERTATAVIIQIHFY